MKLHLAGGYGDAGLTSRFTPAPLASYGFRTQIESATSIGTETLARRHMKLK